VQFAVGPPPWRIGKPDLAHLGPEHDGLCPHLTAQRRVPAPLAHARTGSSQYDHGSHDGECNIEHQLTHDILTWQT